MQKFMVDGVPVRCYLSYHWATVSEGNCPVSGMVDGAILSCTPELQADCSTNSICRILPCEVNIINNHGDVDDDKEYDSDNDKDKELT